MAQIRFQAESRQVFAETRIKQRIFEWGGGRANQDVSENAETESQRSVGCVWQFPVDREIVFLISILIAACIVRCIHSFGTLEWLCRRYNRFNFFPFVSLEI